MIMDRAQPATLGRAPRLGLRVAGAGLLAATGGIHLDLYLTGYRSIPTIGWLFLLQVIAAFGLAAVVLVTGRRLAAAAGAGFALSTLGGYLLSVWIGLFGFKEVRTTAGIVAGVIEVAAFAVLAVLAAVPAPSPAAGAPPQPGSLAARLQVSALAAGLAVAGLSVVALVLLGIAVAGAGGPGPASSGGGAQTVRTVQAGGVTVLADSRSWVMVTAVQPRPLTCSVMRVLMARLVMGSRPVVGSSKKITCGLATTARARATRFCMPPESSEG